MEKWIPLSEIESVEAVRTLGIIPNGLTVTLKTGDQERFVVNGRRRWLELLTT